MQLANLNFKPVVFGRRDREKKRPTPSPTMVADNFLSPVKLK
jgi:hypothetical protein